MAQTTIQLDPEQEVRELVGKTDTLYFKLGELLAKIRRTQLDQRLPFDEQYVSRNLHLKYRRAMYLINIYESFKDASIPERRLKGLAWSKAKEIARLPLKELRTNFKLLAEYAKDNTRQNLVAKINSEFPVIRRRA